MTGNCQLPPALERIIGHETERRQLALLLEKGAVPHALMLVGPSGIGKRCTALAFAAALLGRTRDEPQPPGNWTNEAARRAERLVGVGNHPDLHFLARDPEKKELPVETVRELCHRLQLKPYDSCCTAAIIDNAHQMSIAASNALLMTLEEPHPGTYLVLVTDSPHLLPATIVSRCQLLHFRELSQTEVAAVLGALSAGLDEKLLRAAADYARSSLEALQLSAYVNSKTSQITDAEGLKDHLRQLLVHVERYAALFKPLFDSARDRRRLAAYAVGAATAIGAEKDNTGIAWHALLAELRRKIRDTEQPGRWADVLFAAVEAEQLSRQRSLNLQLQLSEVLLQIAQIE